MSRRLKRSLRLLVANCLGQNNRVASGKSLALFSPLEKRAITKRGKNEMRRDATEIADEDTGLDDCTEFW